MGKRNGIANLLALCWLALVLLAAGCSGDSGESGANIAAPDSSLDLEEFKRYEAGRLGFMHPQSSYSFMEELHIHWQRPHPGPFLWNEIEPRGDGSYDWSGADRYVTRSQDAGVIMMATIWPYADWDQQSCHQKLPGSPRQDFPMLGDYRGKPCDTGAYDRFVRAMVERYDGDGTDDMPGLKYPIKYWEVINEPEMEGELLFFKGEPQAGDYLEVLKETFQSVKAADPEALVMNGGIAALSNQEKPFWDEILGGEGLQYIDIITVHAISANEDLNLTPLQELLDEHGIDKPVWITEIQFGKSSAPGMDEKKPPPGADGMEPPPGGEGQDPPPGAPGEPPPPGAEGMQPPPPGGEGQEPPPPGAPGEPPPPGNGDSGGLPPEDEPKPPGNLSEEEWSALIVKTYVSAFARGAQKLFYVGLDNSGPSEETSLLLNCGEPVKMEKEPVFQQGSCKKQQPFYVFQTMADKIDYFDSVEKLAEGQYRFTGPDGDVYVLWGSSPLPPGLKGTVTVTDLYGKSTEVDASQVVLGDIPVYVEPGG